MHRPGAHVTPSQSDRPPVRLSDYGSPTPRPAALYAHEAARLPHEPGAAVRAARGLGWWLGDGSSGYRTGQLERRLHAHPLVFGFRSVHLTPNLFRSNLSARAAAH